VTLTVTVGLGQVRIKEHAQPVAQLVFGDPFDRRGLVDAFGHGGRCRRGDLQAHRDQAKQQFQEKLQSRLRRLARGAASGARSQGA